MRWAPRRRKRRKRCRPISPVGAWAERIELKTPRNRIPKYRCIWIFRHNGRRIASGAFTSRKRRSVVIPTGEDSNLVLLYLVDEAVFPINSPGPAAFQLMPQGLGLSGAAERFPLNVPDQANDPQGLRPIVFHPPREVLERGGVKFQACQWLRPARAPADALWLPGCGASSFPTSEGEPFPFPTRCRAKQRSAQSPQSARRSHWRHIESRLPPSSTVYSVSVAGGWLNAAETRGQTRRSPHYSVLSNQGTSGLSPGLAPGFIPRPLARFLAPPPRFRTSIHVRLQRYRTLVPNLMQPAKMGRVIDHPLARRHPLREARTARERPQILHVHVGDPRRHQRELVQRIAILQPRHIPRIVIDLQRRRTRARDQPRRRPPAVAPADRLRLDHQRQAIAARPLPGLGQPVHHLARRTGARKLRRRGLRRARLVESEHDEPRQLPAMR